MEAGLCASLEFTVGADDTALALGSGTLPVLATPRLLAWCEAATCTAIDASLPPARTSVGTVVRLEHLAPSAVGDQVSVSAAVVYVDQPRVCLEVVARDLVHGSTIGLAEITRVLVDAERFMERVAAG